jgi:GT2 family glycosyltransferase
MSATSSVKLAVLIPTLGRESVLLDTIQQLLDQAPPPSEILILDQTPRHEPATEQQLAAWDGDGAIRWLHLEMASQPGALNRGLREAVSDVVLCLDDDIRVDPGFIAAHLGALASEEVWAVAGQVLQPGEEEEPLYEHREEGGLLADAHFLFRSANGCFITNGMSGNLCVRRERALQVGGFDENFTPPVSYRFDNEFCKRLVAAGGRIRFEPKARIYHLRAPRGGTRSQGSHLTSASPIHGSGDYYFALRTARGWERFSYMLQRPFREVLSRFHLLRPWWIPVKLLGEGRALAEAIGLHRSGPRLLRSDE